MMAIQIDLFTGAEISAPMNQNEELTTPQSTGHIIYERYGYRIQEL